MTYSKSISTLGNNDAQPEGFSGTDIDLVCNITVGQMVKVMRRMWPGINRPGGVGRVTFVHYNNENYTDKPVTRNKARVSIPSHVNVVYIIEGGTESRVPIEYVKPAPELNFYKNRLNHDTINGSDLQNLNKGKPSHSKLRDRCLIRGRCTQCGSLREDCRSCDGLIRNQGNNSPCFKIKPSKVIKNKRTQKKKSNESKVSNIGSSILFEEQAHKMKPMNGSDFSKGNNASKQFSEKQIIVLNQQKTCPKRAPDQTNATKLSFKDIDYFATGRNQDKNKTPIKSNYSNSEPNTNLSINGKIKNDAFTIAASCERTVVTDEAKNDDQKNYADVNSPVEKIERIKESHPSNFDHSLSKSSKSNSPHARNDSSLLETAQRKKKKYKATNPKDLTVDDIYTTNRKHSTDNCYITDTKVVVQKENDKANEKNQMDSSDSSNVFTNRSLITESIDGSSKPMNEVSFDEPNTKEDLCSVQKSKPTVESNTNSLASQQKNILSGSREPSKADQVYNWLKHKCDGLDRYAPEFIDNGFDSLRRCKLIEEIDLIEMRVKRGHRKEILNAVKDLQNIV